MDSRPIGVFDSGLGGLTAVRQLMLELQDAPNKATERFNRNFTFAELDLRFRLEGEQLSFYDQELEVER